MGGFWNKLIGGGVKEAGEGIKTAADGVGGLFTSIRTAITGVDPVVKARIEETLANAEARMGEIFMEAQNKINLADAQSGSMLQAGWRPAIGWVCALALALYYPTRIIVGMAIWTCQSIQAMQAFIPTNEMPWVSLPPMPEVGISDIIGLVMTLLGSSWLRSQEKKAGVL